MAFNLLFECKLVSPIFKRIWLAVPYRNYSLIVIKSYLWEEIFVDDKGVNERGLEIVRAKKYFTVENFLMLLTTDDRLDFIKFLKSLGSDFSGQWWAVGSKQELCAL